MNNLTFDDKFKDHGYDSQRKYPNEPLIQFLAANYFSIPKKERSKVKILELGCGSGANLWMIAREGFNTYGQDISRAGIELSKKMLKDYDLNATLSVCNFKELDYPNNFFDAIVDVVSLQHTDLAGHAESLAEIYRCLKPGGRFFSYHLGDKSFSYKEHKGGYVDDSTVETIQDPTFPLYGNGPTCFLSVTRAIKLLTHANFTDIGIERFTRTYKKMKQAMEYFAIQASKLPHS